MYYEVESILDPASRTLFLCRHHVSCKICFHSDCCSCPRPSLQGRLVCHISRGVFEMHLYVAPPFQFCIVHVYSQSTSNTHAVMSFIWIWFLCLFSFCLLLNSSWGRLVCVRWATDRWHLTPRAAPPLNDWRVNVMCSGLFSHSPTYLFISVVIVAVTRMLCYMSIWCDSRILALVCSQQFLKSHTLSSFSCLTFNLFTFFLLQTSCRHFTNISQRFDNHFTMDGLSQSQLSSKLSHLFSVIQTVIKLKSPLNQKQNQEHI